jgi:hypothetical protein
MNYFKVGEEVILQSALHPHLNGDCVVLKVGEKKDRKINLVGGGQEIRHDYAYTTTIKTPNGNTWAESALRKKHKPSTESLSTMIEELNKVKV